MKIENVELERNKCKEFIQNNLNVQVTDSNLHTLLIVCKTNKNKAYDYKGDRWQHRV